MTQVEDGKLLSHLEWPKVLLELFTVLMKLNQVLVVFSGLFITQNSQFLNVTSANIVG